MPEANPTSAPILALVRDLMFVSRITATARAAGIAVQVVRNPAQLPETAGRLLLVDLNLPDTIPAAQAWKALAPERQVIGFVSHVDSATIAAAREAGLDQVLARSRFTEILPQILNGGPSRPD